MRRAVVLFSILAGVWHALQVGALDVAAQTWPSPYLACQGSEVIPAATWAHTKVLTSTWADLDLSHARVLRRLFWSITHNDMLEEHATDCGFGLAVVMLVALRAIDYDDGMGQAQEAFRYLKGLLQRLEPYKAEASASGWDVDTTDLVIYPRLLGLEPRHDCHGTRLRIFVYSIGDMTRGPLHCQHGQWGLEALVPQWIRHGSCQTEDPEEADFFFVPWHTWCDRMVYRMNQTKREISKGYIDLMARREELLPHWSRSNGADHIFLFSDQGMNFFPEYRDYIPHSIFLVTEATTPECGPSCFNPWKDVVLPGHTDYFRYRRMRELNLPSGERTILFNFHGRYPGLCHLYRDNAVRGKIMEVFFGKPRVSVGGFVEDYFAIMGLSHFCLVPMGTSSWTNHLYEAFFAGCIPVILSDGFRVPFEGLLDWPAFSVKWPMGNISMDLYHFLDSIQPHELQRMKALVDAHACWFDYHLMLEPPDGACSPYLGLLRSLERRNTQLRTQLPLQRGEAGAFWRR